MREMFGTADIAIVLVSIFRLLVKYLKPCNLRNRFFDQSLPGRGNYTSLLWRSVYEKKESKRIFCNLRI